MLCDGRHATSLAALTPPRSRREAPIAAGIANASPFVMPQGRIRNRANEATVMTDVSIMWLILRSAFENRANEPKTMMDASVSGLARAPMRNRANEPKLEG
jgi:hypothetical protein